MRMENNREDADDGHLLYVSTTYAKEKLIVSGHINRKKDGTLSLASRQKKFGLNKSRFQGIISASQAFPVRKSGLNAIIYPASTETAAYYTPQPVSISIASPLPAEKNSRVKAGLLEPLVSANTIADEKSRLGESDPPQ